MDKEELIALKEERPGNGAAEPAEEPATPAEEAPAEEPAAPAEEAPAEEPAAPAEEAPAEEPAAPAEETPKEEKEPEKPTPPNAPPAPPKKKKTALFVAAGLVLTALLVVLILVLSGPKYESIQVSYSGSQDADTVLDHENPGILVEGVKKDGEKEELPREKWTVAEDVVLEPDKSSTFTVNYKKLSADCTVKCTTSLVKGIQMSYDGDDAEGTVFSPDNPGLHVTAFYVNGKKEDVTKKCTVVDGPITLERDSVLNFTVQFKDPYNGTPFTADASVKCSTRTVVSISASYSGSTKEGVTLDKKNKGISVTGRYKDGETFTVTDWTIDRAQTLVAEKTSSVTIRYEGLIATLAVKCTTVTEETYKKSCVQVSYDELARNTGNYRGKQIQISGRIFQIIKEPSGYISWGGYEYLVATSGRSNNLIHVRFSHSLSSRLLEGDHITIYGTGNGMFSYRTVLGASRSVPDIKAEYLG